MGNKHILVWFSVCLFCVAICNMKVDAFEIVRRSAAPERDSDDYPDYQLGVRYDEYPVSPSFFFIFSMFSFKRIAKPY